MTSTATSIVEAGRPRARRRSRRSSSSSAAARPASPPPSPRRAQRPRVTLLERYPYLGGLASGGMVLVLDDMFNGQEITVTRHLRRDDRAPGASSGLASRRRTRTACRSDGAMWRKWARWGVFDFHSHQKPQPICYAAAFDPDGFKRVSNDLIARGRGQPAPALAGSRRAIVEDGAIKGVICETKAGRQAILGDVVIDATGDLDVAASAGAPVHRGQLHRHHRLPPGRRRHRRGRALRVRGARGVQRDQPRGQAPDRRLLGLLVAEDAAAWRRLVQLPAHGRLRRPEGRRPDRAPTSRAATASPALLDFVRDKLPGFENCLRGRRRAPARHPPDPAARRRLRRDQGGRDRARATSPTASAAAATTTRPTARCCPARSTSLIVAGRHYSATSSAQRMSREIPPCMAMGEAAGVAAALALEGGMPRRVDVDVGKLQARLRERRRRSRATCPSANATVTLRRPHDRMTAHPPAHRHQGASTSRRSCMGPCCHPDAGRLRRRRHQDRAAGRRRPVARPRSPTIRTGSTIRCSAASTATSASIALDLRSEAGKAIVLRSDDDADVVVNNFRAGVMERMGFGYEELARDQPAASSVPSARASARAGP